MFMRVRPRLWLPDRMPVRNTVATKLHSSLNGRLDITFHLLAAARLAFEDQRRVDESHVRERLREIAQRLAGRRIELLAIEACVGGMPEQRLEHLPSALELRAPGQRLDRPEGGDAEGAFA